MGIKTYKPTTSTRRWTTGSDFSDISKKRPEKKLTVPRKKKGGRNSYGRITSRGKGGGHKQKIRLIDFKRDKRDMAAEVIAIEYDPIRTARIALLKYEDGERRYILCPLGIKPGNRVLASEKAEIKAGNSLPLKNIPPGIQIHNIELKPDRGGKMVRSAGASAVIMSKEGSYAHTKMPSGEIRLIDLACWATIGQVGNLESEAISLGKAGRSRHMGRAPLSRGVVKNPVDHPMGGGEGKSSGGRHPSTPWGKITKGLKTRKKKASDRLILKRRK
jgi:large subunit ribosomal protein L2